MMLTLLQGNLSGKTNASALVAWALRYANLREDWSQPCSAKRRRQGRLMRASGVALGVLIQWFRLA